VNTSMSRLTRAAAVAVISGSMVVVAIPALTASPALAATQTITITKSGFVAMNVTIKNGDTVSFTNADVAAHEVLFKATTGYTCTATPVVVQPTKTQSCTWTVAGSYAYSDPNQRDRAFRGTVKVEAVVPVVVPTVSLEASGTVVRYGSPTTISGSVVPRASGTTVDILAKSADETAYTKVSSVVTTNGGAYTLPVTPDLSTSYRAEFQNGTARVVSPVTLVSVRPAVGLVLRSRSDGRARFTVKVTSGITYEGAYVRVQRQNSFGGWTTLKRATLGSFSTARFTVRLPNGTSRIRAFLPTTQAGAGYLSSTSRTATLSR
jgi:plastocyanin